MNSLTSRPLRFVAAAALASMLAGVWALGGRTATRPAPDAAGRTTLTAQGSSPRRMIAARNLSLQPAALRVARRLGRRFAPEGRDVSVLVGTLKLGGEQKQMRVERRQTDDGEEVSVAVQGSPHALTWDAGQGARSPGGLSAQERDLVERLALDSPDQFVLAQLRGASYYTVAKAVRPDGVSDDYAGPLWDVVRVDEARREGVSLPQSPWRLYYVNSRTGLIDRVVSEVGGARVEAAFGGWSEVGGEQAPADITWTRGGQVLMRFSLTNFSHAGQ